MNNQKPEEKKDMIISKAYLRFQRAKSQSLKRIRVNESEKIKMLSQALQEHLNIKLKYQLMKI